MYFSCNWWSAFVPRRWQRPGKELSRSSLHSQAEFVPCPDDYPSFPPPSPLNILQNRNEYWQALSTRKYAAPQGVFEDTPLYALYRLYEFIVLDKVLDYRNALEAFWRQPQWKIHNIPEPDRSGDGGDERFAFLAGCTYLLTRSFNERITLGLRRDMSPLITPDEAERARNMPEHLREYEKVPLWAADAPALAKTLAVPTEDGTLLSDTNDERADPEFLAKNILLWTPHTSFT